MPQRQVVIRDMVTIIRFPVAASHTSRVRSKLADTSRLPSGLNVTSLLGAHVGGGAQDLAILGHRDLGRSEVEKFLTACCLSRPLLRMSLLGADGAAYRGHGQSRIQAIGLGGLSGEVAGDRPWSPMAMDG